MVSLHMVGFPGKQIQLKICFASFNYFVIDSSRFIGNYCISHFLTLFLIFSAFPNHAWINFGDSLHFANSHVFSRQQTCHQWNPEHYILCIWNFYIVADYVWCQVNTFFCLNFWIVSEGQKKLKQRGQIIVTTMLKKLSRLNEERKPSCCTRAPDVMCTSWIQNAFLQCHSLQSNNQF